MQARAERSTDTSYRQLRQVSKTVSVDNGGDLTVGNKSPRKAFSHKGRNVSMHSSRIAALKGSLQIPKTRHFASVEKASCFRITFNRLLIVAGHHLQVFVCVFCQSRL